MTDTAAADVPESIELAHAPTLTVDTDRRTITGTILPYGVRAERTSAGAIVFQSGSLHHHPDLRRIKLLIDHDATQSVGYVTSIEQTEAGVQATFHVPDGPDGDDALDRADNGVRDGLSVGADLLMSHKAADGSHAVVTKSYLNEVSLVALPAFGDARVVTVNASQHTKENRMSEPVIETDATEVAEVEHTDTPDRVHASTRPTTIGQELSHAGQHAPAPYDAQHMATSGGSTLRMAAERVASTVQAGGGAAEIRAALSDVVPANDAGHGFIGRPSFLGQLWEARRIARPVMEGFGPVAQLTKLKEYGWQWVTRPEVDTYAGDKAEIPSNEVATRMVEVTPERIAGGWDVDRIYVDLGDADMVEGLFQAAMEDYALKSETWAVGKVRAAATAITGVESLNAALLALGVQAGSIGATLGVVTFAPDVWSGFLTLTRQDLPWWINPNAGVDVVGGTVRIGGLSLSSNPDLAAGEVLAADSRAITFKESTHRVNAIDLPRGGVDLGVFAYNSARVNDARAVWSTTVTAPVEGQALNADPENTLKGFETAQRDLGASDQGKD